MADQMFDYKTVGSDLEGSNLYSASEGVLDLQVKSNFSYSFSVFINIIPFSVSSQTKRKNLQDAI